MLKNLMAQKNEDIAGKVHLTEPHYMRCTVTNSPMTLLPV